MYRIYGLADQLSENIEDTNSTTELTTTTTIAGPTTTTAAAAAAATIALNKTDGNITTVSSSSRIEFDLNRKLNDLVIKQNNESIIEDGKL